MAQRQQWRSTGEEQAWLAELVASFDRVSRDHSVLADPIEIAALKRQLARPAAALEAKDNAVH